MEISRLRAKALREQREAGQAAVPSLQRSGSSIAGQKRPYSTLSRDGPTTQRDARTDVKDRPLEAIQPSRSLGKYIDYDLSKMADTKGGFLTAEDDPHNKALHAPEESNGKPANMTLREWERQQLVRSLRYERAGPFEPGIGADADENTPRCRECSTLEVDWKWHEVFKLSVCNACKEKFPDKYSLLTKSEAREDYLLTDPELKDANLVTPYGETKPS